MPCTWKSPDTNPGVSSVKVSGHESGRVEHARDLGHHGGRLPAGHGHGRFEERVFRTARDVELIVAGLDFECDLTLCIRVGDRGHAEGMDIADVVEETEVAAAEARERGARNDWLGARVEAHQGDARRHGPGLIRHVHLNSPALGEQEVDAHHLIGYVQRNDPHGRFQCAVLVERAREPSDHAVVHDGIARARPPPVRRPRSRGPRWSR